MQFGNSHLFGGFAELNSFAPGFKGALGGEETGFSGSALTFAAAEVTLYSSFPFFFVPILIFVKTFFPMLIVPLLVFPMRMLALPFIPELLVVGQSPYP